uniref:Solute carrier family 25 member 47a n=2 Tax=Gasterosteus aculeatus aculeatus TaxID=481459 RepID=A0AAQ4R7R1_GASAC|nr:solute carrier family 25 member 47-A isoform X1 [Gasterosteus aculeatus aculeatus]
MHFVDFVSGSFAGACGVAVGYPLDTVKVRVQTQRQFTGIWQCVAVTFSKEGVHGFFKGMTLPLTTITLTSSVVFGTYRNCLQCLSQARGACSGPSGKLDVFLSGMAAGVAQTSVMAPGDIVKVRLQCQTQPKQGGGGGGGGITFKPKYRGPVHCLLSIVREEGFRGLYRGALPLMLRDSMSFATYFLTYATVCELLTETGKKRPSQTVCSPSRRYFRLERRDAGRRRVGSGGLDVGHADGRDQISPADGRRAGDEEVQGLLSLHRGHGEDGRRRRVLQEPRHQLVASVPRQHGGVCRVRGAQRSSPRRRRARRPSSCLGGGLVCC